jgi:hypothetical protein
VKIGYCHSLSRYLKVLPAGGMGDIIEVAVEVWIEFLNWLSKGKPWWVWLFWALISLIAFGVLAVLIAVLFL